MIDIQQNLTDINQQIANINRNTPQTTQLLAVSKTKPASAVVAAYQAGQRKFGENYAQEGADKVQQLADYADIEWHFIGPIQSNKTKLIAENFNWVQSLDRNKIAKRLSEQRPKDMPNLNVCIQVNISNEANKSGLAANQVIDFAEHLTQYSNLTLRGIMAIPLNTDDKAELNKMFGQLHDLYQNLKNSYPAIDTLSMGMSNDMQTAIENGSTMVRIGTAIFGART
ncbi:alanine racemase domain-containing protein [Catenovulum agarivorans DS-2]|uniref:Pyridoxal phosphate homeostasis protein n=1 Tax=Catenovulum agarivorans DS-2 TaxID=1328313 RepID=W7QT63_9ALTE|nr:YggS family pyridoxal phosphate-dependent enzyme [Catenovulum agarivorans]EWH12222.1 alanine racemase domain-containing protein [Catenovulum agarivorans DS-2]